MVRWEPPAKIETGEGTATLLKRWKARGAYYTMPDGRTKWYPRLILDQGYSMKTAIERTDRYKGIHREWRTDLKTGEEILIEKAMIFSDPFALRRRKKTPVETIVETIEKQIIEAEEPVVVKTEIEEVFTEPVKVEVKADPKTVQTETSHDETPPEVAKYEDELSVYGVTSNQKSWCCEYCEECFYECIDLVLHIQREHKGQPHPTCSDEEKEEHEESKAKDFVPLGLAVIGVCFLLLLGAGS